MAPGYPREGVRSPPGATISSWGLPLSPQGTDPPATVGSVGQVSIAGSVVLSSTLQVTSAAVFSAAVSVVSAFTFGSHVHLPYVSTTASVVVSTAQVLSMGTSCTAWLIVTVSGTAYRLALFSAS